MNTRKDPGTKAAGRSAAVNGRMLSTPDRNCLATASKPMRLLTTPSGGHEASESLEPPFALNIVKSWAEYFANDISVKQQRA
jgi:hypothetical protein